MTVTPFGPFSTQRHYRFNDFAGFLQDAWKVSPRLTLSPGIRYEYFGQGHRTSDEKPLDARSLYYLGMAHAQAKHKAEAKEALNRALQAGLGDAEASDAQRVLADIGGS